MPDKPKIIFIHLGESSFVKEDLNILQKHFRIEVFFFDPKKSKFGIITGVKLFFNFVKQFFWVLKNYRGAQAFYCWFSDYHAVIPLFFSRVFKLPFITVLGGVDCNKIESLNYGIFCSRLRAPLGKYVLTNSTLLLPVDEHLISTTEISKYWKEAHPDGVKNNVDNFNTPWKAIPTGYDSISWQFGPLEREKVVSTVAFCSNYKTALIKGWDLFVEVSKLLPEFNFNIVGVDTKFIDELKNHYSTGTNLIFTPPRKREDLQEIYQNTSVYLQLSRSEGLPNVLCEAMMCGCVPVGSPVFGIPNCIGDTGFIAKKPIPEDIANLVVKAHTEADTLRYKTRERIEEHFSISKREHTLLTLMKEEILRSN